MYGLELDLTEAPGCLRLAFQRDNLARYMPFTCSRLVVVSCDVRTELKTQRSMDDTLRKLNNDQTNNCNNVDFIKGLQQLQKVGYSSHMLHCYTEFDCRYMP